MDALTSLVVRAQTDDLDAYSLLVRRFQDMAVGYAYSILGDFHLAEDAAQEAFLRAYLDLGQLREPAAFAGWFRRIVFVRCNRLTRKKQMAPVALDVEMAADDPGPDEVLESREMKDRVHRAIQALPEAEREVTTLYYMGGYGQKEIGEFLEVSTQTVKSRLHAARNRLRERMTGMAKKHLQEARPSNDPDFQVKVLQDLEEVAQLTDRDIQRMLREVDTKDLALAMVHASDALRERINVNISARVGKIIEEYIASQMPVAEDRAAKHRARVVEIARALIAGGDIAWPPSKKKLQLPEKPLSFGRFSTEKEYLEMKENLKQQLRDMPAPFWDFEALMHALVDLADIAHVEGLLALEDVVKEVNDPDDFFVLGLRLIVDGSAPQLVEEILASRMNVLLRRYESKLAMIKTGIQATQRGEPPRVIEQRLVGMY